MTAEVEVPIFELPLNELLEAAAVPMREEATNDINCEVRAFISQLFEREKASIPQIIFEIFFCGVDPLQRLSITNEVCKFKEVTQHILIQHNTT